MPRRKTPSLVSSEYVVSEGDDSVQMWESRKLLVQVILRVCPTFLDQLATKVFPIYQRLASKNLDCVALGNDPYKRLIKVDAQVLNSAITRWAHHLNAEVPWVLDEAVRILRGWHIAPEWLASRRWNLHYRCSVPNAIGEPFEFRCEGWEASRFSWRHYCEFLRREFEKTLAEYENQARARAESKGLVRARRKYSERNFEWFVLYQFAGMSSSDIVKRFADKNIHFEDSAVLKGIKAAATLIGWDHLREPKQTRSRKIR